MAYAIRCYSCDTKKACKSPKKVECNNGLANTTRAYLDFHHTGINPNTTSPFIECMQERIKSNQGEFEYKGCVYSNINVCQLPLRDFHTSGRYERTCAKCNDKDLCNPAGRASISGFALIATVVMGLLVRKISA
ncbi:uncharacterized protein LOC106083850 isoform X2 [Stomoxys calcitrans]|uniref:Protein sleepless n=1 Tax=Stomoxys calcitrans TaxID=35570 RepID=A0A1I8PRR4_STOCA|nr:uncharacterized protein LOC106083850 isoform X2 [Stomoxys calcitrans]